jgi:hypothetical protein
MQWKIILKYYNRLLGNKQEPQSGAKKPGMGI